MRLWHIELIPYLPKKQLVAQWRECVAIVNKIDKCKSPQHGLVNKIMMFKPEIFYAYCKRVYVECINRGINVKESLMREITQKIYKNEQVFGKMSELDVFWHNNRYLRQCYYNLEEKYDCGLILEEEWIRVLDCACLNTL